ncbi:MAG: hypothetical protein WCD76_10430 [Pyrinomonadaceae bacterium]
MSHANLIRLCLSALLLVSGINSLKAPARTISPAYGTCTVNTAKGSKAEDSPPPDALGGIKLTVTGGDGKPLGRKRFFLLEKDIQHAGGLDWNAVPRRDSFLSGASIELRAWLKRHDCDSIYCPEYEAEYESAARSVPEFKTAYEEGLRKYKNPKLALRWITVNLPLRKARTEFYARKKAWLEQAARQGGEVMSVMTDEKGVAYFTGVRLKDYYISNLIPLEDGDVLWNCAVTVQPPIPRQLYSVAVELAYPKPPTPAASSN